MSAPQLPTSRQVELAQARRHRRRAGVKRARIIAAVFGAAFVLGTIGGILTPGA